MTRPDPLDGPDAELIADLQARAWRDPALRVALVDVWSVAFVAGVRGNGYRNPFTLAALEDAHASGSAPTSAG